MSIGKARDLALLEGGFNDGSDDYGVDLLVGVVGVEGVVEVEVVLFDVFGEVYFLSVDVEIT